MKYTHLYKHNIVMYHESVISIRIVQKKKNNNNNILYECITKIHWTGKSYIRLFHYLAAGNRECFIQAIEGFFSNGSRSNRPQTKSAPSQIGPKPNRSQIKSAPNKIGILLFFFFLLNYTYGYYWLVVHNDIMFIQMSIFHKISLV
jgi:hypothetical protein